MVMLKELLSAIEVNASRSYMLPTCRMKQASQTAVDMFRRISAPVHTPVVPKVSLLPNLKKTVNDVDNVMDVPPVPTRTLTSTSPTTAQPTAQPPVVKKPVQDAVMIVPPPAASVPIQAPVIQTPLASSPPKTQTQAPAEENKRSMDPLRLGISERDPMYAIATPAVKQSIEAEEARVLESKLAELYKEESGRSRGWVKTHIEAFLIPRAANGAQQGTAKMVFDWAQLWTDKQTSAILDYLCMAKNIRLAVWKEEGREIGLWPAADSNRPSDTPPTLYHVTSAGVPLHRPGSMEGWRLRAPIAVEHALEKLTLAELDNVGKSLGLTDLVGKKGDRVRVIASARMAMRLSGSGGTSEGTI